MFTRISISRSFTKSQWFSFSTAKKTERKLNPGAMSPLLFLDLGLQLSKAESSSGTKGELQVSLHQNASLNWGETIPCQHMSTGLRLFTGFARSPCFPSYQSFHLSMHFCTNKVTIHLHTGFQFSLKSTLHQWKPRQAMKSVCSSGERLWEDPSEMLYPFHASKPYRGALYPYSSYWREAAHRANHVFT